MKLEVKMYVRFKNGEIDKIEKIEENSNYYDIKFSQSKLLDDKENYNITKASYNIIDLIEVGDYVNGFPVEDYFHKYNEEKDIFENVGVITTECYLENSNFSWILAKDIKTILTHEQFENNCFRIGEQV